MASNEVPTQGQQADNTPEWLKEVKADAEFNYKRLLREQQEKAAHEEAKAQRKDK
jgi:hypothetical protein